jgi:hypothetical protein
MALLTVNDLFSKNIFTEQTMRSGLSEELLLSSNGNMHFHWADFHETCDLIKNRMQQDPALMEEYRKKEASLGRLKLIPVWIRTQHRIIQTTIHSLYEQYLLNQQHPTSIDPHTPLDISLLSGSGPYKTMAIAECFNFNTYRDFVLVYLLQGRLSKRDFRVRLNTKVLAEYGKNFAEAQLLMLEQISADGLFFSVDSEVFTERLAHADGMRLLIDSEVLREAVGKDLEGMKSYFSSRPGHLLYSARKGNGVSCRVSDFRVQSSFDFVKTKKVYLFINFKSLGPDSKVLVQDMQTFISHAREVVLEKFSPQLQIKSA